MEAVLLIVALLFVAFVALGVVVSVKAVRAAKRGVDRTITQARRTVEDTTLRAKSLGQTGVPAELAQLRLSLRTSMRATQEALRAHESEDASLAEALSLFQRLSVHGRELDDELRRLERDPDRATIARRVPELRERTERITKSADALRWAARDRARKFSEDELTLLSEQIDVETGALRHWSAVEPTAEADPARDGHAADPARDGSGERRTASDPAPQAAPGPTEWPEPEPASGPEPAGRTGRPAGADPTLADQTWPEPPPVGEGRQAIEPPDPRRTTYPWQEKSTRPETTN
ncbi:procyclic acidic repetitive family protein [Streptomyces sp. NBC_01498]|uniref:hypothetical protein n=1 Tax=Streptomyces sp. NBC_01498 TaxID=2975870 RepID=UPI002E7BBE7F|nr:hypothetical protein [Streptomyces sp. NBC_01498]WTL26958.1 procyclic acidic repetitive family protein [Streptomyces sp. NBC_01498]